jgi:predicted CoA-binding protein
MDLSLSPEELVALFAESGTIAVVGASSDTAKQAHRIPRYLQSQGYRIVPVNPAGGRILGERAVASLAETAEPVDVVEVFRPAEEAPAIARQAIACGASVLWLQLGITSEVAAQIAREAGLRVVMDACMGAIHKKLVRRHGFGS